MLSHSIFYAWRRKLFRAPLPILSFKHICVFAFLVFAHSIEIFTQCGFGNSNLGNGFLEGLLLNEYVNV